MSTYVRSSINAPADINVGGDSKYADKVGKHGRNVWTQTESEWTNKQEAMVISYYQIFNQAWTKDHGQF